MELTLRMRLRALLVAGILILSIFSGCTFKAEGLDEETIIVTASYYPWYHPVDGKWEDGITGMPLLGFYESDDWSIISRHIEWATGCGISGFFVEWSGLKAPSYDDSLKIMLQHPDSRKIKFSLTYAVSIALGTVWEQGAQGKKPDEIDWTVNCSDPDVEARFLKDIDYAAKNYFWRENFLKVKGRPVFYLWASATMKGDAIGLLQKARKMVAEKYGMNVYFIGEEVMWGSSPELERVRAFDAVMPYVMINMSVPPSESYPLEKSLSSIIAQYEGWSNVCRDLGIGFIPGVFPGYNDKNRTAYYVEKDGKVDTMTPVVTRSVESFRSFCSEARKLVDPDVGLINIASWNEWFEGSTVEPSKQYGFEYLEVIKEVLSNYRLVQGEARNQVKFVFNKVVRPCDVFPGSSDERHNAVAFDYIDFLDKDRRLITRIDIGTDEARRNLGIGWSGNEGRWGTAVENFVWAGGVDKYATVYTKIPRDAAYIRIHALPIVDGVSIRVLIEGNEVSEIRMGLDWNKYEVLISLNTITLSLSQSSTTVNSSITMSGEITPKYSVPVTLEYRIQGGEWKNLATVVSNTGGSYSYTWTPPSLGTYEIIASCGWGANYTGAVSNIVFLTVTRIRSMMILNVSESSVTVGSQVRVTGFLTPLEAGAKITLTLIKPDSTKMVATVTTGGDGMFTHVFTVGEAGPWTIRATREGNATHEAAENTISITVGKNKVSVSCSVSKQRITLGETIIVSGAMNPPIPGGAVSLLFTRPNGETFSVMVETLADGSFSHSFKPEEKGEWRVEARWGGSLNYGSAASPLTIFTVEEPFPITYVMLGVTIIIIGLAGWFFAKSKGKSKS
ncbi:MAG: glycoside hydrolase family 99-like domain-containing protein [Thermoproteota archaeon]